jgi:protein-tyrosine phosphatase
MPVTTAHGQMRPQTMGESDQRGRASMIAMSNPARHIDLEGCFNFRDLGGYRAADGRAVRWRHLYRADGLQRLTPSDLAVLDDLGVVTVIDLRTPVELSERGRFDGSGRSVSFHHLPMIDVLPNPDEYPSWVEPQFVAARYAEMLDTGAESVRRVLEILADTQSYPAVFHCAAGKDRTGILAALVLGLLGVPDDEISSDYALSARAMSRMLDWLRHEHPDRVEELDRRENAILSADPSVMAGLLAALRDEHGSLEGYAAAIGADGSLEPLRANLLAG